MSQPAISLNSLGFAPRRSNHYATWAPVYLEPMVASGERLCIGVVTADKEKLIITAVPNLDRLSCVYGDEADAFIVASRLALRSVEPYVKRHGIESLTSWDGPIEGLIIGAPRIGAGETLEEVARTALMQSASLVMKLSESEDAEHPAKVEASVRRLETLVRESLISDHPLFEDCFGKTLSVSANARSTRIGFIGKKIVANFGLLVPGKLAPLVDKAKAKLWDLNQVKTGAMGGLFTNTGLNFELLLHRIRDDDPQYSDRQVASIGAAFLELEAEADKVDIRCRGMHTTADIASFLAEKEAA